MLNVRLSENIVYNVQIQTVVILIVYTVCDCDCEVSVYSTYSPVCLRLNKLWAMQLSHGPD